MSCINKNKLTKLQIIDILSTCYDPEIAMDIVNLGLIYNVEIILQENDNNKIIVTMTLTSPFCTMSDIFVSEIKQKLSMLDTVTDVEVTFIFEPPWSKEMMSDEARFALNIF